ncbi:MAG: DUF2288 domain-containing protein [Gammaproteobacteria bacterium]|nr:DUF2288 domain-containing protein [Gammaproteobacteria bacterium]
MSQSLNLETSKIPWSELQRFFAAGKVVYVDAALDLVQVAEAMSGDDKAQFEQWMAEGVVDLLGDEQARIWIEDNASVWAVVIKPWVLVQAI